MIWPSNAGKLELGDDVHVVLRRRRLRAPAPDRRAERPTLPARALLRRGGAGGAPRRELPNVFGVDLLNEPSPGYIGWEQLEVPAGAGGGRPMPSPLQSMALGMGRCLEVKRFHRGLVGPRVASVERLNPGGLRAWREGARCPWLEHGVWANGDPPRLLRPRHFSHLDESASVVRAGFSRAVSSPRERRGSTAWRRTSR